MKLLLVVVLLLLIGFLNVWTEKLEEKYRDRKKGYESEEDVPY